MFRLWGKTVIDNHTLNDMVVEDSSEETRTHKVLNALEKICMDFDLQKPIWLEKNVTDFKRTSRTRFDQDSFIETIDFDYLDIQIIEED